MISYLDLMTQIIGDPYAQDTQHEISAIIISPLIEYMMEIYPSKEFLDILSWQPKLKLTRLWQESFKQKVLSFFPHLETIGLDPLEEGIYILQRISNIEAEIEEASMEDIFSCLGKDEIAKFDLSCLTNFLSTYLSNE